MPTGQVIAKPLRIRDEPTDLAISTTAQICVTGMPTRSISLTIVDPQRVLVPHVEVRMAAVMPLSSRDCAIFSPFAFAAATLAQLPQVT